MNGGTGLSVTVVIPTRNRMVHLREALASALDQTLPPREVIVVDDASRPEVAPQLTELEPHGVRVIRSPDRIGGGAARNLGWRQAQTELDAVGERVR